MNAALFAYSRRGCATARRVMAALADWDIQPYTMERFAEDGFAPLGRPAREFYGPIFGDVQAMIFVSSVGLAVREVAPHLKSKATDPAVLVLDELGQYVIPVLSGHIGGANELAKALAASLEAQAVITTATDINGRFSVDAWAVQNGCAIASLPLAKADSAAVLVIAAGLYAYDSAVWSRGEWGDYRRFDDSRIALSDYGIPAYEEIPDTYDSLGLSETAVEVLQSWNFYDPDLFDKETMDAITAARNAAKPAPSLGECLGKLLDTCTVRFFESIRPCTCCSSCSRSGSPAGSMICAAGSPLLRNSVCSAFSTSISSAAGAILSTAWIWGF